MALHKHYRQSVTVTDAAREVTVHRKRAKRLIVFGVVRFTLWSLMAVFTLSAIMGVHQMDWASHIANKVIFVALISYYANAATDFDATTSAYAAFVAADAQRARNAPCPHCGLSPMP